MKMYKEENMTLFGAFEVIDSKSIAIGEVRTLQNLNSLPKGAYVRMFELFELLFQLDRPKSSATMTGGLRNTTATRQLVPEVYDKPPKL